MKSSLIPSDNEDEEQKNSTEEQDGIPEIQLKFDEWEVINKHDFNDTSF
jgi:hypothetical protein